MENKTNKSLDQVMQEIYEMRHDPLISGIIEKHNSSILLHTLTLNPGYIEYNVNLIEKIRKSFYLRLAAAIHDNFCMFSICPYELVRRTIDGQSCIVPMVPQFGSWTVVLENVAHGQTAVKIFDKNQSKKEYKYIESSRFPDGFNVYTPGMIKSLYGSFVKRYASFKSHVLQQNLENQRYLKAKPYQQKITGKTSAAATDLSYDRMVETNLDADDLPPGINQGEEIVESKTARNLPLGWQMATFQPDFQHKTLFNLMEEKKELQSDFAMLICEPLDSVRSEKASMGHANAKYVEESRNQKTAAVILEINDIVQGLQTIWMSIYKRENPNIKIEHGLVLGIDDLLKLRDQEIIAPELARKLAHEQVGIRTVKRDGAQQKKKQKIEEVTQNS